MDTTLTDAAGSCRMKNRGDPCSNLEFLERRQASDDRYTFDNTVATRFEHGVYTTEPGKTRQLHGINTVDQGLPWTNPAETRRAPDKPGRTRRLHGLDTDQHGLTRFVNKRWLIFDFLHSAYRSQTCNVNRQQDKQK